ncbi:helix-turn-helix transcriptional regulator [Wenzhouxiangella sp. EGI_FJ10409]|uniref:helix-turn-helix transcriptional regulator n=1 Tax=Wenzhouxiangella sp. EGI_FJ10409 TaxID=3243767 RepID=UPI0035E0B53C
MPNKSFLTTEEAAEYVGLQKSTLEAWRCRGGGPRFVKMGRAVRYRLVDLDAWIESRLRENTIGEVA